MAIGVLIKRVTKQGVDAKVLLPLIVELRSLAVRQPGYLSGETFFNLDRPEECVVIEDSPHGIAGAKAAGMTCVGLRNVHSGNQDLSAQRLHRSADLESR